MTVACLCVSSAVNKHKPWIETTYHGIITENDDKVLLDPPLIALDKDAPLRYAGKRGAVALPLERHPSRVRVSALAAMNQALNGKRELNVMLCHGTRRTVQSVCL